MKGLLLEAKWKVRDSYELSEKEKRTGAARNGNCVWKDPKISIQELPKPLIKSDEVLIKVKTAAVCGSDAHMIHSDSEGYIDLAAHTRFPCIIGHEFSGVIEEIGSEVKDLSAGDIVTAESMNWCGKCMSCRKGMFNQCKNLEEIGFTIDGGFAEYVAAKEKFCFKLDELFNAYDNEEEVFEAGATVEPVSVVYNGMFASAGGYSPGGHIAIFGAGSIGLAAIALAKTTGAAAVIAFEKVRERRELAKKIGADYVFNPLELAKQKISSAKVIMDITKGEGAAVLVEATGTATKYIMPEMEKALAVGGKIVQIGVSSERTPVFLLNIQIQAAKLSGSMGHAGHGIFPSVIKLMAYKRLDMTQVITDRFPLDRGIEAIEKVGTGRTGKVIIKP